MKSKMIIKNKELIKLTRPEHRVPKPEEKLHKPGAATFFHIVVPDKICSNKTKMSAIYKVWGPNLIEKEAIEQIDNACSLPISVKGALMPDGHMGYGLPVGGVLGTDSVVIPYAVGVDISCSVKLSIFDIPSKELLGNIERFKLAISQETRFGVGSEFKKKRNHDVMDEDWSISPITFHNKTKAWSQLGTSGSGNHFVEFGIFKVAKNGLGLKPGEYLGLLSHSGSRGVGAMVCDHYSKLARQKCPLKEKGLSHLSWLKMNSHEGQEYWEAMQLMHKYAWANHELIHKHLAENLGAQVLFTFINSHNLAWKEIHDNKELIVHRKGATPANKGQLGIIPGSMTTPSYLVEGKGNEQSLRSCAHGAGRLMSRSEAKRTLVQSYWNNYLEDHGVTLISAGLDEMPAVYKNINDVMEAQKDLISIVGEFHPTLVKMAPEDERAED